MSPTPTICEAYGCEEPVLTVFGDGLGRQVWLCEDHGDDLAIGFPLKPDVCPIDCSCRDPENPF